MYLRSIYMETDLSISINMTIVKSAADKRNKIHLPAVVDSQLAEMIGVLAGDGHVSLKHYYIEIAFHLFDDAQYAEYVQSLFLEVFNLSFFQHERPKINTLSLKKRSRSVVQYITSLGFSKNNCIITIPSFIEESRECTRAFVRGLFDTNGCIAMRKNHGKYGLYPIVSITLKDVSTLAFVKHFLDGEQIPSSFFNSSYFDKRTQRTYIQAKLQINGYKHVELWWNTIYPANLKHKEKMGTLGFEFLDQDAMFKVSQDTYVSMKR